MARHYFLKMIALVVLLVLAVFAWRGHEWAFVTEIVAIGLAAIAEILVALSIVAMDKDEEERRKK